MKEILEIFLESKIPTSNWNDFITLHKDNEDKFVFHIRIMFDKNLIKTLSNDNKTGINQAYRGDEYEYSISITEWRLSSEGHDFASAIVNKNILNTIKKQFKEEGLSTIIDISKKIMIKKANKLLDEL